MGSFEIRVRRSSKGSSGAGSLNASSYNGSEPAFPIPPPGVPSLLVSLKILNRVVVNLLCMSMSAALEIMPCLRDRSSHFKLMRLRKPAGTAFASTASMDIPAGEMVQQGATQASMDSVDFDDESTVFLTAPKVAIS